MKIFIAKFWAFAILLAIILISAIIITVLLLGKINQLNDEATKLHNLIADEGQSHDNALIEIDAAKAENEKLRASNEILRAENETMRTEKDALRQYQLTYFIPSGFDIAIDQRLDQELVILIKKHFSALAAGNKDEFRVTIGRADDYLLGIFERRKNTAYDITSIFVPEETSASVLQNGGFYLFVSFVREGKMNLYDAIGVTKKEGKWVIYDYD